MSLVTVVEKDSRGYLSLGAWNDKKIKLFILYHVLMFMYLRRSYVEIKTLFKGDYEVDHMLLLITNWLNFSN